MENFGILNTIIQIMNKPQKHVSRFIFILMAIALCVPAIHPACAKEPAYDGRPMSDWLLARSDEKQQNAIRQIGTNAIPTLLDILGVKEKTLRKVLARLDNKDLRRDILNDKEFNLDDLRDLAVIGFGILGTNAEPVIPQMYKLLNDEETSFKAAEALVKVGPKGFAALTNGLTSPDAAVRDSVVNALGQKGGGDSNVITQLLVNALKDEADGVRGNAAMFLAGRNPELVIPALLPLLNDQQPYPQRKAVMALGSFGAAAKSAAPKILSIYTNAPDGIIFGSLRAIDPEMAGKAEEFIVNSGPTNAARLLYTTTLLKNGMKLIAGGYIHTEIPAVANRALASAELIDPRTGKWRETGEMHVARAMHTAILLPNGKVLVVGGIDSNGSDLSSTELYDPTTETWTMTGTLNKPRSNAPVILQPKGKVLVFSERYRGPIFDVEQYDTATGKWTVVTNMTQRPK